MSNEVASLFRQRMNSQSSLKKIQIQTPYFYILVIISSFGWRQWANGFKIWCANVHCSMAYANKTQWLAILIQFHCPQLWKKMIFKSTILKTTQLPRKTNPRNKITNSNLSSKCKQQISISKPYWQKPLQYIFEGKK